MDNTNSILDDGYWTERYAEKKTGWDIGNPSTPLKEYIDKLKDTSLKILIPGCGNAYEAEYLLQKGFTDLTLIDISELLVNKLKQKFSGKTVQIIHKDFFFITIDMISYWNKLSFAPCTPLKEMIMP